MKRNIVILLLITFIGALFITSCADPRKNCNHPMHYQYVKDKRMKKYGF